MKSKELKMIAYWGILIAGIMLRFVRLGSTPLTESEATLALQALDWSKGVSNFSVTQPLYVAVTAVLFRLFGSTEFLARLLSALCGLSLLLIPIRLSDKKNAFTRLWLTFFIAFNPILITWSRQADAAVPVLAAMSYALIALKEKRATNSIFLFALTFACGMRFFPLFIALLVTAAILSILDILFFGHNFTPLRHLMSILKPNHWKMFVLLISLFSTGFLIFPESLNGMGNAILTIFKADQTLHIGFIPGIIAFLVYAIVPILLLVYWIIHGLKIKFYLPLFYLFGLLFFIITTLVLGQGVLTLLWITLPLLIVTVAPVCKKLEEKNFSIEPISIFSSLILPILFFFLLFRFSELARLGDLSLPLVFNWQQQQIVLPLTRAAAYGIVILFCILIFAILLPIFLNSIYPGKVKQGLILGILMILGNLQLHQSWSAAGLNTGNDFYQMRNYGVSRELALGKPVYQAPNEITRIAKEISIHTSGFPERGEGTIVISDDPILKWEFRRSEKVQFNDVLNLKTTQPDFVISHWEENKELSAAYKGLVSDWVATPLWNQFGYLDWINWLLYRQPLENVSQITLWQKNNLLLSADE